MYGRRWFHQQPVHGREVKDIAWFTLEGEQMAEVDWGRGYAKSLGIFLDGTTIPNPNTRGEPVIDDRFYMIFNAHYEPLRFTLPGALWGEVWLKELDTAIGWVKDENLFSAGEQLEVEARSIVLLRHAT